MSGVVGGPVATTAVVIAAKSSPVIIAKLISIFGGFAANFLLSNFFCVSLEVGRFKVIGDSIACVVVLLIVVGT